MITFHTLRWKNFLSTGNAFTEISLDANKNTLIVGTNGAGKSTILDALCFSLYNKPFRKINKPQLVNSINKKNCVVEIEFSVGKKKYKVIRGIKPTLFEVYCGDTLLNQPGDSRDYQEALEKSILKLNHKSFSQIVVLGSASFVPFMQLTASNRREIIEDLLDIQIFSVMNSLLKEKYNQLKEDITECKYGIDSTSEKIDIHKKHLETLKSDASTVIKEKQGKIEKLRDSIVDTNTSITTKNEIVQQLTTEISDSGKVAAKHGKLIDLQSQINQKIKKVSREIEFFSNNDTCPTCSQEITEDFKNKVTSEKHEHSSKLSEGLDKLKTEITSVLEVMEKHKNVAVKINDEFKNIAILNSKIVGYKEAIQELEIEITNLQQKSLAMDSNSEELNKLNEQYNTLVNAKKEFDQIRTLFDVALILLKDTGIKTKIIKQYIPVINKLINKYLASMDFFVNFELNENFEESIKSRFRDDFSYQSFSEGEKARLDLALLFTWRSIAKLRNSANTNLLILDEVFDGSLDNTGNDELLKIIQTLTPGNNVFVISHKTDVFLDKFDKVIKFEKHKNFSRIIES